MSDVYKSTDTTEGDLGVTGEMMPLEPLSESREIPHDESPQHSVAESPLVNEPRAVPAQKPRRKIRKLLFIALFFFIIVGIVGAGWYVFFYMKTPAYAFEQIRKAYDTHDVGLFEQYVDADAFCQQTVDDYMTWVDQNDLVGTATDIWSELGKTIAESMIQSMKPQMVAEMKKNLLNSVEEANATFASSTFTLRNDIFSMANPESFLNQTPLSAVKTGKVTTLKFMVFDSKYNQNLEIDLLLRDTGKHLQVVRMGNFADWLDNITRLEQLRVDQANALEQERVDRVNATTTANMEETIVISTSHWEWDVPNAWTTYVDMTVSTSLKNAANKSIDEYGLTLTFSDSSGNKITDVDFSGNHLIKANSSLTVTSHLYLNLYDSNDKRIFDSMKKGGSTFTINYNHIHFTDGTELKCIQFKPIKKFQ